MKFIIFILTLLFSVSSFSAPKNVDIDWTRKGLDIDFPAYKYQTRKIRSEYRSIERAPSRLTRKAFREMDRSINRSISYKINKIFN